MYNKLPLVRKVSVKGQTVLPVELRRSLGIQEGDLVEFVEIAPGKWSIQKPQSINPFKRYIGAFKDKDLLQGMSTSEFMAEVRGMPTSEDEV